MVLPPSMQGSLPAGWLAFTGRELNPLDRDEGFQITSSSFLPGLFLAQHPQTFTKAEVARLFDHLIGAGKQCWRDAEAERLRGLEIENELEFGGPFDRDVAGFRAL